MNQLGQAFIELRPAKYGLDVHGNIIRHLPQRLLTGNAIVVCEQPERLMPPYCKRWKQLIKACERHYASTLDATTRKGIAERLQFLRATQFVHRLPTKITGPLVWLAAKDDLTKLPGHCMTIYVSTPVAVSYIHAWLLQLPPKSTIIIYEKETKSIP